MLASRLLAYLPLATCHSFLATPYSPLTTHYSTTHYSTTRYPLLLATAGYYSLYALLTTRHYSLRTAYRWLLGPGCWRMTSCGRTSAACFLLLSLLLVLVLLLLHRSCDVHLGDGATSHAVEAGVGSHENVDRISSYLIRSYRVVSRCFASFRIVSRRITSYRAVSDSISSDRMWSMWS